MTEAEWLTSSEPSRMLWFVTENPDHQNITCCRSERKLQLLAEVWASPVCGEARYCLGSILPAGRIDNACQEIAINITAKFRPVAAQILRGMVGNPFRPYTLDPKYRTPLVLRLAEAAYEERKRQETCSRCNGKRRVWDDDPRLGIFENYKMDCPTCHGTGTIDRDDGTLDPQRLAILADALEDAGVSVGAVHEFNNGGWMYWWNDAYPDVPHLTPDRALAHPLLARLRSGDPFYRGEASLDVILDRR